MPEIIFAPVHGGKKCERGVSACAEVAEMATTGYEPNLVFFTTVLQAFVQLCVRIKS